MTSAVAYGRSGLWVTLPTQIFDAYMLTVKGTDGTEFVGHPKDF